MEYEDGLAMLSRESKFSITSIDPMVIKSHSTAIALIAGEASCFPVKPSGYELLPHPCFPQDSSQTSERTKKKYV